MIISQINSRTAKPKPKDVAVSSTTNAFAEQGEVKKAVSGSSEFIEALLNDRPPSGATTGLGGDELESLQGVSHS